MHRNPFPAIKHLLWFLKDERISRNRFEEFRNRIPKSRMICERASLPGIESEYDVFIVGSDQVWNPRILAINPKQFDRTYLLDFVKCKTKYAYAASMGDNVSLNETFQSEYVEAWKSFAGITMREKEGADFVGALIGKAVETVVDPVLLHDIEYWRKVATRGHCGEKKFALIYNLRQSRQLMVVAHKVAETQKLETVNLLIPGLVTDRKNMMTSAGPAEMLEYIDSAEYIFTGSFHAVAFSIIYGKKLFVQLVKGGVKSNSRIENLLSLCNLTGNIVFEDSSTIIKFYDCSLKDPAKLEAATNKANSVLAQMVSCRYV